MNVHSAKRAGLVTFGMLLVAAPVGPPAAAQQAVPPSKAQDAEQPISFWMQKKLDHSKSVLAGLAAGDFEQIAKSAESMRSLSKIEGFIRNRTPEYRVQLQLFDEANRELVAQAKDENVEGAALAFSQLTVSCVKCHKILRSE